MNLSQLNPTSSAAIPGSDVEVLFGPGTLSRLPELVQSLGCQRVLLVTDDGIRQAGHLDSALRFLYRAGIVVRVFDDVVENPTTHTVTKGIRIAMDLKPDLIVGLGGGSSMDAAKGINFIYTNGGRMHDYWGTGKASRPMLPLIAIPTTAGTGSEAQSYALITDPETHQKMACGDRKALPRYAILDPDLTATCPIAVAAATGIDAIAHAIETAACNRRNDTSRALSKEAWRRLSTCFEQIMTHPAADSADARAGMLLGAHLAGAAIENSMLGAAHATANPLTAYFNITHGVAVGMMLPHVIRFNSADGEAAENPYADLEPDAQRLAQRIEALLDCARMPRSPRAFDVQEKDIDRLAEMAARQWTAGFNPRKVQQPELAEIYRMALA